MTTLGVDEPPAETEADVANHQPPLANQPPAATATEAAVAGPAARSPAQSELLDVHRRTVELLLAMKARSAKGAKKQGRYRAHDTARKHVLKTMVSRASRVLLVTFFFSRRHCFELRCLFAPLAAGTCYARALSPQVLPDLKFGRLPDDITCRMLFELPGDAEIEGRPAEKKQMDAWAKAVYTDPRSKPPTLDDPQTQLSILLWARHEGPRITAPQPLSAKRGALPVYRFDFGHKFNGLTVMEVARESPWFLAWLCGMRTSTVRRGVLRFICHIILT